MLFATFNVINAIPTSVQCTSTPAEPNACYILSPVYLKPGEAFIIDNATNLGNVTHFELKSYTNIVSIPLAIWTTFPKLEELIMANYASVSTLATTDFIYAPELRILNLKGNKLISLPYMTFALAAKLEAIDLSYNGITEIEDLAFNNLNDLEILDLSYNRLSLLQHFTLAGANNLKVLDLSHNKIKLIDDGSLNLPKLSVLNFNTNDVKTLPDNLFGVAPIQTAPLVYVDFGENKLTHIGQSFYGLTELSLLNLTSNKKIDDLNLGAFAALPKLETLLLSSTGIILTPMAPTLLSATAVPTSDSPLKKLYLAKNKLINPDILKQLAFFRQLELLSLEENRFTFIDNVNSLSTWFPNLHTIYIGENKLNCDWLNASIPVFQEADINVYTVKKVKTWYGTTYEKKLIDMEDCFDLEKVFTNLISFLSKLPGKPTI